MQQLLDYGIQTECSDQRVHVSPSTRHLYVFPTGEAQKLLADRGAEYREVYAYQEGVGYATAKGVLVPCSDIPKLRRVDLRTEYHIWEKFRRELSTRTRGCLAVEAVRWALPNGRLPLFIPAPSESENIDIQREGTDLVVWSKIRIQVKCDWDAGPRELGGTGNLFFQTAEVNPLGHH